MTTTPEAPARRDTGRYLAAGGLALAALGVAGYAAQLALHRLTTPWYLPALTTAGAALAAVALWRRRGVWRGLVLVLTLLANVPAWGIVLGTRLPAYAGPVEVGKPFPEFATARADGTPFARRDLEGGPNHVLVFFRGRW